MAWWNNDDLVKQTQRTQVNGIANLQWAASDLSNPQSLTHAAVARGPIWLCALGLTVLLGCTPLHIILAIFTAASLTKLSPGI